MENLVLSNLNYNPIKSVVPLYGNPGTELKQGVAKIEVFEYKKDPWNFRSMLQPSFMSCPDGHYVRLVVSGELMMSDTLMERRTNMKFVQAANGVVLVAGLGLGMVIQALLNKPDVTNIIVIEKYKDVIDLVSPKFKDSRLEIIEADIFHWKPDKGTKFDTIYFDIWPNICVDNLDEIKTLHNRFKGFVNRHNPNCYMNSWLKEFLQKEKRKC